MRSILAAFFVSLTLLTSCVSFKSRFIGKSLEKQGQEFQHQNGFALYDIEDQRFLFQDNADKYFVPASNTKILTFYSAITLLGDSIPALDYVVRGDSLIFWGTGDPSLLNNRVYNNNRVLKFLKESGRKLYFSYSNYFDTHLGNGWMWDDYYYRFSAERSPMPLYGNALEITKTDTTKNIHINIPYFKRYFYLNDSLDNGLAIVRGLENNTLQYFPRDGGFEKSVPFHYSAALAAQLLTDTLRKPVIAIGLPKLRNAKRLYSVPTDSILKVMMQDSDNFLAEQLLIVCSSTLSDSLSVGATTNYMLENHLKDLPDKPLWKDGSGLSRYNLITPRSVVALWEKIYNSTGQSRLFGLLAVGGKSGTLKNYYSAEPPYIYGKTGTLSNVHNLSGFLITKKGKVLIFSYMNNNHPIASKEIKSAMERLLWSIHEKY